MNLGAKQVDVLRHLKTAFDPNSILNPGKIFDL
jgi:FAD/FMN-containing dehydrogenase